MSFERRIVNILCWRDWIWFNYLCRLVWAFALQITQPLVRAVEIPCQTCLTWSHFIQDKLKISIYMSLDKYKCIKWIQSVFHILINYYELTCHIVNSVYPDQLTSSEASWSGSTLFTREASWSESTLFICFHNVFERVNCLSTERYKLISSFRQVKFSLDKYIMAIYLSLDK